MISNIVDLATLRKLKETRGCDFTCRLEKATPASVAHPFLKATSRKTSGARHKTE